MYPTKLEMFHQSFNLFYDKKLSVFTFRKYRPMQISVKGRGNVNISVEGLPRFQTTFFRIKTLTRVSPGTHATP